MNSRLCLPPAASLLVPAIVCCLLLSGCGQETRGPIGEFEEGSAANSPATAADPFDGPTDNVPAATEESQMPKGLPEPLTAEIADAVVPSSAAAEHLDSMAPQIMLRNNVSGGAAEKERAAAVVPQNQHVMDLKDQLRSAPPGMGGSSGGRPFGRFIQPAQGITADTDLQREHVERDLPNAAAGPRIMFGAGVNSSSTETAPSPQPHLYDFQLQPGEELWVIQAADRSSEPVVTDGSVPGCGALLAHLPDQQQTVPVPLKHTAVQAAVDGYIATVQVKQEFHNPFDSKIEAVYLFPLPQNAAVSEFVMTIGDRRIRGIIRERAQAEQIYEQARARGHVASLLTQERSNVFTQKVANIEPGRQIDIDIQYFHTLRYEDGAYEFAFPMVIGPRYNPAGTSDPVTSVPRNQSNGRADTVEYLSPTERSGHDIALSLELQAGVKVENVESVNHLIQTQPLESGGQRITLAADETIPNRDFVLRYQVAGDTIKSSLMTHQDQHGQYFTLMFYPPAKLSSLQRSPLEMVFVLDCSGSMNGQPLDQAKAAIRHALQSLTPRDSFQLIRFSSNASQLGPDPLPVTPDNIRRGLAWLSSIEGSGGTEMIEGIRTALDFPHDEGRLRLVTFLTDGFIGNEQQILTTLHQKRGSARVFSFGVGQSPNRYLMDRMAITGRGAVAYLSLNDDAVEVMNRFSECISHPALTDVAIDWGEMQVHDVYPTRLPDLVVGRPIVVTGRFTGEPGVVRVGGQAAGQTIDYEVPLAGEGEPHAGIAAVWARHRIQDLMNHQTENPETANAVKRSILQTALNHGLMSAWTAFVAVDSLSVTAGTEGTTVQVPVPVPEGVQYDTTVAPTPNGG